MTKEMKDLIARRTMYKQQFDHVNERIDELRKDCKHSFIFDRELTISVDHRRVFKCHDCGMEKID